MYKPLILVCFLVESLGKDVGCIEMALAHTVRFGVFYRVNRTCVSPNL